MIHLSAPHSLTSIADKDLELHLRQRNRHARRRRRGRTLLQRLVRGRRLPRPAGLDPQSGAAVPFAYRPDGCTRAFRPAALSAPLFLQRDDASLRIRYLHITTSRHHLRRKGQFLRRARQCCGWRER